MASVKAWTESEDFILSKHYKNMLDRHLYKIELQTEAIATSHKNNLIDKAVKKSEDIATFIMLSFLIIHFLIYLLC